VLSPGEAPLQQLQKARAGLRRPTSNGVVQQAAAGVDRRIVGSAGVHPIQEASVRPLVHQRPPQGLNIAGRDVGEQGLQPRLPQGSEGARRLRSRRCAGLHEILIIICHVLELSVGCSNFCRESLHLQGRIAFPLGGCGHLASQGLFLLCFSSQLQAQTSQLLLGLRACGLGLPQSSHLELQGLGPGGLGLGEAAAEVVDPRQLQQRRGAETGLAPGGPCRGGTRAAGLPLLRNRRALRRPALRGGISSQRSGIRR